MSFVSVMNARLVPTMGKVRIFDGVIGAVESRLLFARVYVVSPVSLLLALAPLLVATTVVACATFSKPLEITRY